MSVLERPILKHLFNRSQKFFLEKNLKYFVLSGICSGSDTVSQYYQIVSNCVFLVHIPQEASLIFLGTHRKPVFGVLDGDFV